MLELWTHLFVCEREREPLNEFSCREPVRHDSLNVIRCLYAFLLADVTQETSMSGPVLHTWLTAHDLQLWRYVNRLSSPHSGTFFSFSPPVSLWRRGLDSVFPVLPWQMGVKAHFHNFCHQLGKNSRPIKGRMSRLNPAPFVGKKSLKSVTSSKTAKLSSRVKVINIW